MTKVTSLESALVGAGDLKSENEILERSEAFQTSVCPLINSAGGWHLEAALPAPGTTQPKCLKCLAV